MDQTGYKAGSTVYCADQRFGTLVGVEGTPQARLLVLQPDGEGDVLRLPVIYVASAGDNRVVLNMTCADVWKVAGQLAGPAAPDVQGDRNTIAIPLVEEQLVPETRWVQAGAVEIAKHVRTGVQEIDVPLQFEQAVVEHVAVNRVLRDDEVPQPRQEGDTLIVPVVHEQLVVLKQRVLVEEVRITKQVATRTEHVAEEVRREEIALSHPGLQSHPAQEQ